MIAAAFLNLRSMPQKPQLVLHAYEGYYQVDFKPVALEWHDLTDMQHFTQVTILYSRVHLVIAYAGQEEVGYKGWGHHQRGNAVSL